jgi:hypothetical protein
MIKKPYALLSFVSMELKIMQYHHWSSLCLKCTMIYMGEFIVGVSQHEHDTFLSCVLSSKTKWMFLDIKQWKGDMYV